jgi:hypothetical protein
MYNNSSLKDCGCAPSLRDEAGKASLKAIYEKDSDKGGVSFIEKLGGNIPVLGTGALIGVVAGFFAAKSTKKKGSK